MTKTKSTLEQIADLQKQQADLDQQKKSILKDAQKEFITNTKNAIKTAAESLYEGNERKAFVAVLHSMGLNADDLNDLEQATPKKDNRGKKVSQDVKENIKQVLIDESKKEASKRKSSKEIADEFDVSPATVNGIKKDAGLTKSKK